MSWKEMGWRDAFGRTGEGAREMLAIWIGMVWA